IMRKSLLQELVPPNAGAAVGQEADIVVDRLCVPVRREQGEENSGGEPSGAYEKRVSRRNASKESEHARRLRRGEESPPSIRRAIVQPVGEPGNLGDLSPLLAFGEDAK